MQPLTAVFSQLAVDDTLIDSDSRGAHLGSPVQPWQSSWMDDNSCSTASGDVHG